MLNIKKAVGIFSTVALCAGFNAQATVTHNQSVTPNAIFGTGNANGHFTVDKRGGIELGIRAKIPGNGNVNSNGDGTYSYTLAETDHDNDESAVTPNRWNFDWTVNIDSDDSSALNLDDYTYELGLDADPGLGTNYLVFDPITPTETTPYYDHSIGDNTTAQSAGIEAPEDDGPAYAALIAANNVLQNSWRYAFFNTGVLTSFNPDVAGTYSIYLLARNAEGAIVARTEIQVLIEGAPAAATNDITPDVIFGSGNANGNFTKTTESGVEVGLRAKIPFAGLTNFNGDGTYSYSLTETDAGSNPDRWNFDWTINVDVDGTSGLKLDDFTYEIGLDGDPSFGTDFLVFDPVTPTEETPSFDHSIGDNMTANGGGLETNDTATYQTRLSTSNVLQQSWRYSFFQTGELANFDPNVPGTYAVYLLVRNSSGAVVARSDIQVLIGGALAAPLDEGEVCPIFKSNTGRVGTFCL